MSTQEESIKQFRISRMLEFKRVLRDIKHATASEICSITDAFNARTRAMERALKKTLRAERAEKFAHARSAYVSEQLILVREEIDAIWRKYHQNISDWEAKNK